MTKTRLKPSDIRIRLAFKETEQNPKNGRREPLLFRAFDLLLANRKSGGTSHERN